MKRSPILGYNHNISHRGLVFHVQTEDSGVDHPHIFTHLFYGGVILNTRKLDYDPSSAEESVKSLMQAQHKSILKLLKRGEFDDKITRYFGDNPDLQPPKSAQPAAAAEPASPPSVANSGAAGDSAIAKTQPETPAQDPSEVSAAFEAIREDDTEPQPQADPASFQRADSDSMYSVRPRGVERMAQPRKPAGSSSSPDIVHDQPTMPVQRARPAAARRPSGKIRRISQRSGEAKRRAAPSVVVSRPAVIIGAPSKVIGSGKPQPNTSRARPRRFAREDAGSQGLFGKDLISEKSLDEVILAYLSEDSSED